MSFDNRRRPRPPRRAEARPEEPERYFFDLESARPDHRVRSLCRQTLEAVSLAFLDVDDPRLDGAWVLSVDPVLGPARLDVCVVLPQAVGREGVEAARSAVAEKAPWLRSEVARSINRKRAPELASRIVLDGEIDHE